MTGEPVRLDRPEPDRIGRARALAVALAAAWVLADQITKTWALRTLVDRDLDVVWTLRFNLAFNTGMAFSQGNGLGPVIGVIALGVVIALVVSLRRTSRIGIIGTGLVIGGAMGNVADRLFRNGGSEDGGGFLGGAVVDFIDLQWWPIFNVADIGISVGAVLLVLSSLRAPTDSRHATEPEPEPESDDPDAATAEGTDDADLDRDAPDRP
jgi:signal peptidase II